MEVPSTAAGTVQDVKVRVGDKVSQGMVLLTIASNGDAGSARAAQPAAAPPPKANGGTIDLVVPDIGDFKDVPVVEVLVKPGQSIAKETPLAVLESEKASMEVPASAAGTIASISVKPGDKVSQGSVIATLHATGEAIAKPEPERSEPAQSQASATPAATAPAAAAPVAASDGRVHASPAIRRFARELGVDLAGCAETVRTAASRAKTCRASSSRRSSEAGLRAAPRSRAFRRGRRSTSRSSERSSASRSRASRNFPARTCIATGCRFRTSRTTTKPTSPISKHFAARSTPSRANAATARSSRCSRFSSRFGLRR